MRHKLAALAALSVVLSPGSARSEEDCNGLTYEQAVSAPEPAGLARLFGARRQPLAPFYTDQPTVARVRPALNPNNLRIGIWIHLLSNCGPKPVELLQRFNKLSNGFKIRWVALKCGDGVEAWPKQFNQPNLSAFANGGFHVLAYQTVYLTDVATAQKEAAVANAAMKMEDQQGKLVSGLIIMPTQRKSPNADDDEQNSPEFYCASGMTEAAINAYFDALVVPNNIKVKALVPYALPDWHPEEEDLYRLFWRSRRCNVVMPWTPWLAFANNWHDDVSTDKLPKKAVGQVGDYWSDALPNNVSLAPVGQASREPTKPSYLKEFFKEMKSVNVKKIKGASLFALEYMSADDLTQLGDPDSDIGSIYK